jgi:hypothetical protein
MVQKYERLGVKFLHSNESKGDFRHVRIYSNGSGSFDVVYLTGYGDVIRMKHGVNVTDAKALFREWSKFITW